ncbi:unnamed protein product [Linum trigynum]|uniref:EF-hand domain-containing protein n=1 Tax=Linum trigynum TaxID=586398 RepID=A0AAV2DSJ7_9ROSI
MSVEVLDGNTIVNFVGDEEAFTVSVHELFANLDSDHDGQLSYSEMLKELQSLRVFEIHFGIDESMSPSELTREYESLFTKFDNDSNGTVDLEEFKAETRQMMLAMASAERDGVLAGSDGAGRGQPIEESRGVGDCYASCLRM